MTLCALRRRQRIVGEFDAVRFQSQPRTTFINRSNHAGLPVITPREIGNTLLTSLRTPVISRLEMHRRRVESRETLLVMQRDPFEVFFPEPGVLISLVRATSEGSEVEVGAAGSEGFAGVTALFGPGPTATTAIVQAGGDVWCVNASRLRSEFANDSLTRAMLMAYTSVFLDHMSQSIVCNRVHTIEQRLSRCLLMMRERRGLDSIRLSHEFLSRMLGSQRSGVTLSIAGLTEAGLITHARRLVTVRDPAGLEKRACGCYRTMVDKLTEYREQQRRGRV
jgi:CRP-like cAMP-binding protein